MLAIILCVLGIVLPISLITLRHYVENGKFDLGRKWTMRIKYFQWWDLVLAFAAVWFLISVGTLIVMFTSKAEAGEYFFPDTPIVFLGMDKENDGPSIFCEKSGGGWVGNLGIRQPVFQYKHFRTNLHYIHHSCAFEEDDRETYDAFGFQFEWDFTPNN